MMDETEEQHVYDGPERRKPTRLSDEEIERIAARVRTSFYNEVGRVTVRSALYVIGAAVVALFGWLGVSGHIK